MGAVVQRLPITPALQGPIARLRVAPRRSAPGVHIAR